MKVSRFLRCLASVATTVALLGRTLTVKYIALTVGGKVEEVDSVSAKITTQ